MSTTIQDYVKIDQREKCPQTLPVEPDALVCGLRERGTWGHFTKTGPLHKRTIAFTGRDFGYGVMVDVKFWCVNQSVSCGGEYTGLARGNLLEMQPNPEKLQTARKIRFERCSGTFFDAATNKSLYSCTALFLLPKGRALYIP